MSVPKLGLALGGGGARGFAHLGVLKAFQENSITIDYLAGISLGATMAAGYAHKKDLCKLEQYVLERKYMSFVGIKNLHIKLNTEKMITYLDQYFESANLEDLQIPLQIVATDLKTMKPIVLKEGSVSFAVTASSTFPYINNPLPHKEFLLVDGGLLLDVPLNTVQSMGADIVIGVDVSFPQKTTTHELPIQFQKNAYLITPDLADVGVVSFHKASQAIEKGYAAAKKFLRDFQVAEAPFSQKLKVAF